MEPTPSDLPPEFTVAGRRVRPALNRIDGRPGFDGSDSPVLVEPRVMEVLVCLARRRGEVVSKEELVREVWGGRYVSDDVVWRSIGELRRALGDDARAPRAIQTVARRGYRLLPEGGEPAAAPLPTVEPPPAAPPIPGLRRATALGLTLAVLLAALLGAARFAGRSPDPERIRVAVLPFAALGRPDTRPSQATGRDSPWADGLTDELISALGALAPGRLGVVGRTSVLSYEGQPLDLRRLGRELGVDYVLEGSVRPQGERLRIAVRLLQVSDQTVVWSESREVDPRDTRHLPDRIADRVAEALALPSDRRAAAAPAVNAAAWDALLRGRYLLQRGTGESVAASVPWFERAVAEGPDDPASAPAWAGLADALHLLALSGALAPGDGYPRAEEAARRALEIDPRLADTRATLGSILFRHHWDWPAAEAEFQRAVADGPGSAVAHHDYAWFLVALGRFDEGLAHMRRARALDPLSLRANADVGWVLYRARRTPEAIAEMRRLLDLEPGFAAARQCLERALIERGALAEALAVAREGLRLRDLPPAEVETLTAGPPAEALLRLAVWRLRQLDERARTEWVSPFQLAARAAELGNRRRALEELERAWVARDPALPTLAVDPVFDDLRQELRYRALVARLRLPG